MHAAGRGRARKEPQARAWERAPSRRRPGVARAPFAPFASVAALAVAAVVLVVAGCADRRAAQDTGVQAHPAQWNAPASVDFHGTRVLASGPTTCVGCHGTNYEGTTTVPSCFGCHDGPGGHPGGWAQRGAANFHGKTVETTGPTPCKACHGSDYRGGWSARSCFECHSGGPSGHPDGWLNPRSSSFHGLLVLTSGVDQCTRCHGFGLSGGTSGVGCGDCHL
jgi:hypothetical protein